MRQSQKQSQIQTHNRTMISLRVQVKRVGQANKHSQKQKKTISETNKQSHNDLSQSPSRESGTSGTREPPVHTAHTAQVQNNYHDKWL